MKKMMLIVFYWVFMSFCITAQAFYDDSCETHVVVTNVMGFGAVADGTTDDTAAFQAAIDYVTANGGGDLEVPAGTYVLKGVVLKSNVHLLVDSGAVLNLTEPGNMINISGDVDWVENVSVQGVGGKFTVNFPIGLDGTRFISVGKTRNFLLSDFHVNGNVSSYSSVVMGVSGFDVATRGMPTRGTMRNASISHSSYGYGLIQSQACDSILFTNLHANGGVALRMETGWDKMGNLQYGGVFNVVGRNISAENAKAAVMMAPVGLQQGLVDIDGVYATNCATAVSISDGSLRVLTNPDIFPGSYAKGSSVRNVTCVFGLSAQYKADPTDDTPDEYTNFVFEVDHAVYGAPWIGPSLSVVGNGTEYVDVYNVRSYGFKYAPPIKKNGGGLTEETFFSTNYAVTITGNFWSATTHLNPGGTNWISGNGSVGQMDLTTATAEHHALNFWGFALEADQDASISSDFRYNHESGGDITASLGEAAFGLLFSTDPDPSSGTNRTCLLGNKGSGLGLIDDAASLIAHTTLNVDTAAGGWSDWFRVKWVIEQGAANYQGTPHIYDSATNLLYAGPTMDLGVTNGTKVWAGYTTGTNSVGGSISGFSGFEQVDVDNFVFETSDVNEAPIWLEEPAHMYAMANVAYTNSLRGLVLEPNGRRVKYSKLSGPDWVDIEESGWITGTPSAFDVGSNGVDVVATDYEGLAVTNRLIISVSSSASGSFSLPPIADATVRGGIYETNNYGVGRTVTVQDNTNPDRMREVYLKFDLSQVSGDAVTNAFVRLKVTVPDENIDQAVWSVSDDSWQEDTITYDNRPPAVTSLTNGPIPDFGWWIELNVTDYVQGEWSGDQAVSLALIATGGWQAAYHSKDDMPGHRPELVVQTVVTNNTAPAFSGAVVDGAAATPGAAYSSTLTNVVFDADGDSLGFRVLSGPAWLNLSASGVLTGTPTAIDWGLNSWQVEVTDGVSGSDIATLNINVTSAGSGSWVELLNDDFEVGWGNYTNGGVNAFLSPDNAMGAQCVNIENNSGDASSFWLTRSLDLTGYTKLTVEFTFMPVGMNDVEDFWLQYSDDGGSSWTTIQTWVNGIDFSNGTRENPVITIDNAGYSFSDDAKIKFRCDASGGGDDIFIDNVVLSGLTAASAGWNTFISAHALDGAKTNHTDSDGMNDWGEYVFGGNPTNPADLGTLPSFDRSTGDYVFSLVGDNSIVAQVLTNADLVSGSWGTNETIRVTATNGVLGTYTNVIDTSVDNLFFKLKVE